MNLPQRDCSINSATTVDSVTRELVLAAQAGSNSAFEKLQKLYSPRLFGRIFTIMRNREDTEDVLQDTFLRAYLALGSFERRSKFNTWLTRIAINSALMTLRKRHNHGEVSLEQLAISEDDTSLVFDVKDSAPNPEQVCDQLQRLRQMFVEIQKLDGKLRTTATLLATYECSIGEIAQTLSISVAAAKSRVLRVRKRLRRSRKDRVSMLVPQS